MQEEYTTKQLAERFEVTPRTIQPWVTSKVLPVVSAHRGRYLIDTDALTTFSIPQEEEKEAATDSSELDQRLKDIEKRLHHLERRKIVIVIRWSVKKKDGIYAK